MYWVNRDNPTEFLSHPIDGVDGIARKWLLDKIPDNESVLDIGCGAGHIAEVFRKNGRHNEYHGLDRDETIEFARSLFPYAKYSYADANFLPCEDNSWDNCILFTVVEMMPDFRKAVDEAFRVCKKRTIITIYRPLIDGPDKNHHKVNQFADCVVDINRDKFLNYINSLTDKIETGIIEHEGKIEYWYWILNK